MDKIKIVRYFWIALGFLCFGLGVIGVFMPLIPATPFFLLTVYAFSKGSEKFSKWFASTRFHHTYIESYRPGQAVALKKKLEIIASVTVVLSISFYFTERLYLRLLLLSVFIGHIIYFGLIVKTKKKEKKDD